MTNEFMYKIRLGTAGIGDLKKGQEVEYQGPDGAKRKVKVTSLKDPYITFKGPEEDFPFFRLFLQSKGVLASPADGK